MLDPIAGLQNTFVKNKLPCLNRVDFGILLRRGATAQDLTPELLQVKPTNRGMEMKKLSQHQNADTDWQGFS